MRLSHSRMGAILGNPLKYKASNLVGLWEKEQNAALAIGSAVHWGLEMGTSELQPYFDEHGTQHQKHHYTFEQLLSESMVYGYLKNKDEIMNDILTDDDGNKLELIDEIHELEIIAPLKSNRYDEDHRFKGIIDLVLLTDKGFIIIDYKTSKYKPNWDNYLEQIYRYIFLLRAEFPDVPVYRVGIINLRKAGIRQKKSETEFAFLQRLRLEYELNEDAYINYHMYDPEKLNKDVVDNYLRNISETADFAQNLVDNEFWYWNYGDQWGGKYYDVCHGIDNSWTWFNVDDTVINEETGELTWFREAREIDMKAIYINNCLRKYDQFEMQALAYYAVTQTMLKEKLFEHIKQSFVTDDDLLENYWLALQVKILKTDEESTEQEEQV